MDNLMDLFLQFIGLDLSALPDTLQWLTGLFLFVLFFLFFWDCIRFILNYHRRI